MLKKIIKSLIPPIFINIFNKLRLKNKNNTSPYGWFGDYQTWNEALKECEGYNSDIIIEKCKESLLKVKNGEAVYERDSYIFDQVQYSWPLLAGLLWIAAQNDGRINVLDFGGSLGSTYFQNKKFLNSLKEVSWNIVEQEKFVECGKKYFEDDNIHFYLSTDQCIKKNEINVMIYSNVIQYLSHPFNILKENNCYGIKYLIFDVVPIIDAEKDRITIQKVPPEIYSASYPAWFFNEDSLRNCMIDQYELIEEFESYIAQGIQIDNIIPTKYKGFIFIKNEKSRCK